MREICLFFLGVLQLSGWFVIEYKSDSCGWRYEVKIEELRNYEIYRFSLLNFFVKK